MITCDVCGTKNPEGTQYCEGCGVEVTPAIPAPSGVPETAGGGGILNNLPNVEGSTLDAPVLDTPALDMPTIDTTPAAPVNIEKAAATEPAVAPVIKPVIEPVVAPVVAPTVEPVATPEEAPTPVVEEPVAAATETAFKAARLVIKQFGAPTANSIPLQSQRLVVGRFDASSGPVDIDVSSLAGAEHISRRHAELFWQNGWHVRDLGSTNGVFVKRAQDSAYLPRISDIVALYSGDEVAFGNMQLIFQED